MFPACAVSRSMAKKSSDSVRKTSPDDVSLENSFFCQLEDEKTCTNKIDTCTKDNDTHTNTCTHEDKQTHDMSDEAQNVDESELVLDKESKERSLDAGEKLVIMLPIPGDPLRAHSGPYVVEKKVSDVNYVIQTPDRQGEKRLCHVNMLKKYVESNPSEVVTPVFCVADNEVEAVQSFPPAATKMELMRFLKMAGFYRWFCHNFLDVMAPLTDLQKNARFSDVVAPLTECQTVFDRGKSILSSGSVLAAPD